MFLVLINLELYLRNVQIDVKVNFLTSMPETWGDAITQKILRQTFENIFLLSCLPKGILKKETHRTITPNNSEAVCNLTSNIYTLRVKKEKNTDG